MCPDFHLFKEVLLVEGLVANLISIGQLCDDDLEVHFNKLSVKVFDSNMNCIMSGCRSSDNCYMAGKKKDVITCNSTRVEEANLWHQRLGHVNYGQIGKLMKNDAVRGLPDFKVTDQNMCGDCQKRKTDSCEP